MERSKRNVSCNAVFYLPNVTELYIGPYFSARRSPITFQVKRFEIVVTMTTNKMFPYHAL